MAGRDIIVIGASAGGIEALQTLVGLLPPDLAASVFVVVHVPSESPSMLPVILERAGKLPAVSPEDKEEFGRGTIYVAPPDHHLLIQHDRVRVVRGPKENRHRPAIDPLFRSAAWAYGPRVAGLVLSGYLDDGVAGLWAVKTCGGVAIVQDPADAQVPDMPRNAMMTVEVDHSLPMKQIGPLLARLAEEPLGNGEKHPVPEGIKRETEFALMERDIGDMNGLGTLSAFTCPACHGPLWELRDGAMVRYRCHTGHAYSSESLLAHDGEAVEDALYSALRALEEKAMISRRVAESFAEEFPQLHAQHLARADELEEKVLILRNLIAGTNGQASKKTKRRKKRSHK